MRKYLFVNIKRHKRDESWTSKEMKKKQFGNKETKKHENCLPVLLAFSDSVDYFVVGVTLLDVPPDKVAPVV
jgi:hypothetical protein